MAGGLSSRVLNMKFMRNALTKEQKSKISLQPNSRSSTNGNNLETKDQAEVPLKDTYSSIQERKYRWSIDGVKSLDVLKRKNKQVNKFQAVGYSGMTEFFDDSEDENDAGDTKLVGRIVLGEEPKVTASKSELDELLDVDKKDNSNPDEESEEEGLIKSTKLAKRPAKQKNEIKKEEKQDLQETNTNDTEQVISQLFGKAEDFQNKSNVIPSVPNFLKGDDGDAKDNNKRTSSNTKPENKRNKNGNNKRKKRKM